MRNFMSEKLPSGASISITSNPDKFYISYIEEMALVSSEDIARMYSLVCMDKEIEPDLNKLRYIAYQNDPIHKVFQDRIREVLEHTATMPIACYPEAIRHICIPAEQAKQMLDMLQHQYRVYMKTKYGDIIKFDDETT